MKILFCTNTFENGNNGPSRFANYLLEINHMFGNTEIRILTEDVSDESLRTYNNKVIKLNLRLGFFSKPWGFIYRMFPYYQASAKIYRDFPFDILVFNNAITGIWSAARFELPVLGMINDDTSATTSFRNFNGSRKWCRHIIFKYLEIIAVRVQNGIIVNSNYLKHIIAEKYRVTPTQLHLLYKGVKLKKVSLQTGTISNSLLKILFVKADFIRGGLYDLIAALDSLTNYHFRLQIVGPEIRFKNELLVHNKSPHILVDFIGPASGKMIRELMKDNHFFVVPSRSEALGVANMEALLAGITVITTHAGGIPEVMNFGSNGWMVSPGNPKELAEAIRYAIENAVERRKKQINGHNFMFQNFAHTKTMERFVQILKMHVS